MILNIRSMDDLPKMERWLMMEHFTESIMHIGPALARYISYRVVPPPPQMYADVEKYGYYNWRVTEHWFPYGRQPFSSTLNARWTCKSVPDYEDIVGPMAGGMVPLVHAQDFKGEELTLDDPPMLRWYIAMKYPEGVSVEEGEDWYLNVHSKEVLQQPGLTRYFTSPTLEMPEGQRIWHRLVEQWYDGFNSWRKAVIESPPEYTRPPWAKYNEYPFLEPYVDFASTFILEKPTNDNLRDSLAYIPA